MSYAPSSHARAAGSPALPGARARAGTGAGLMDRAFMLALGLPVFLYPSGRVFRGSAFESAAVLPISIFVGAALLAVEFLVRRRHTLDRRAEVPLVVVAGAALLVYCAGEALRRDPVAPQVWALYFLPVLVGGLGGAALGRRVGPRVLLDWFALPLAAVAAMHVAWSIASLGVVGTFVQRGADDVFGLFGVYQKFIYYPLVVMFANVYLLLFAPKTPLRIAAIVALGTVTIMTAAREPLVVFALALMLYLAWARRIAPIVATLALTAALVGAVVANADRFANFALFVKFTQLTSSDPEQRTGGRLHEIALQMDDAQSSFLLGDAFTMAPGFERSPHNQYVEYVLRGGALFLVPILCVLAAGGLAAARLARHDPVYRYFAIILVTLVVVSFNFNTPMRAPYSSTFVWAIVGYVLMRRSAALRAERAGAVPALT